MRRVVGMVCLVGVLACSNEEKHTIVDAPFAGDVGPDKGKEDSWRFPWNGGPMMVGEQRFGEFDNVHGWVGYEIDLNAGEVEIDLGDANGAATGGVDTLLLVYGPKSPSGRYPRYALAVNDDIDPTSNTNSHVTLNAPEAGTYRLVASTYFNYVNYPYNTSQGEYVLSVECPRAEQEGSDACGLQISNLGESCWNDLECAAGSHCEGEITCAPGTQCFFVQEGTCVADYVWMVHDTKQCGQNPWQQSASVGDGESPGYQAEELQAIDDYYEDQGIQLLALGLVDLPGDFTCLSCACSRGDALLVQARPDDAAALFDNGFSFVNENSGLFQMNPLQCDSNPWQESSNVFEEVAGVRQWATSQNVELGVAGFVYATELVAVCKACSCPRGDVLVVSPAANTFADAVLALGFGPIYRP